MGGQSRGPRIRKLWLENYYDSSSTHCSITYWLRPEDEACAETVAARAVRAKSLYCILSSDKCALQVSVLKVFDIKTRSRE
jgi:hypothetical protein